MEMTSIQNTAQIRDQWLTPARAKHAPGTIRSFLGNVSKFPVSAKYEKEVKSFTYTVYKQKEGQIDRHELNSMPPSPSKWGFNCHDYDIISESANSLNMSV